MITSAIEHKFSDKETAQTEAKKFNISYCTRVGKYRMGADRAISVTFKQKEDKDRLMLAKSQLPRGIYINNEFPPHIKRNRDRL